MRWFDWKSAFVGAGVLFGLACFPFVGDKLIVPVITKIRNMVGGKK